MGGVGAEKGRPEGGLVWSPSGAPQVPFLGEGGPGVRPLWSRRPGRVQLPPWLLCLSRWTICARVTQKGQIRTWSNSRGEGKLFSMEMVDESVSVGLAQAGAAPGKAQVGAVWGHEESPFLSPPEAGASPKGPSAAVSGASRRAGRLGRGLGPDRLPV